MTDDEFRQAVQKAIEKFRVLATDNSPDVFLMTAEVEAILMEHIPPQSPTFSPLTVRSMGLYGIPCESYMRPAEVQARAMELQAMGKRVAICKVEGVDDDP